MFAGIGLIAFICTFGAALIGLFLGKRLRLGDQTEATQKSVQNTMNIVGVLSALVLGLMVANAKASFDTRSREIEQFAVGLTLLDRELMHFGQEMKGARETLRDFTARKTALIWPVDRHTRTMHDDQSVQMLDQIEEQLRTLSPSTEFQRDGRANALQLTAEVKRTSRLLTVQENNRTPPVFLIVATFWLSLLFLSYAIFAPRNIVVILALLASSVAVSTAANLIFDMDRPFAGFIRVSPAPMHDALAAMKP